MHRKFWIFSSGMLMVIVGVLRILGGIALLTNGREMDTDITMVAGDNQINFVVGGLFVVGIMLILAAVILLVTKSKRSWGLSWFVLLLFLLTGLSNGYILFGHPQVRGQLINFAAAAVIGVFLYIGKSSLTTK